LARQGAFTEKAFLRKASDHSLLAAGRYNGELHAAALNIEDGIGGIALREYGVIGQALAYRFPARILVSKSCGSNGSTFPNKAPIFFESVTEL